MKIIPVGNDYALAARLRSVKAEKSDEVTNTANQPEETGKEGNKGEEASVQSTEGKKKARRFKKEAISEEGEE